MVTAERSNFYRSIPMNRFNTELKYRNYFKIVNDNFMAIKIK
jgi:hypothetical protein